MWHCRHGFGCHFIKSTVYRMSLWNWMTMTVTTATTVITVATKGQIDIDKYMVQCFSVTIQYIQSTYDFAYKVLKNVKLFEKEMKYKERIYLSVIFSFWHLLDVLTLYTNNFQLFSAQFKNAQYLISSKKYPLVATMCVCVNSNKPFYAVCISAWNFMIMHVKYDETHCRHSMENSQVIIKWPFTFESLFTFNEHTSFCLSIVLDCVHATFQNVIIAPNSSD